MTTQYAFDTSLTPAAFIKRYKRFFVDAETATGEIITAHCANTGSMKGLLNAGATAYFKHHDDPKRKLKYSLEMITAPEGSLVGVNTSIPNKLVADAIMAGDIPELADYTTLKREVRYGVDGKSRIDILLEDATQPPCYVEVKNVTLRVGDTAQFPDAVTTRGLKHLRELTDSRQNGQRAVMFYLVQRADCTSFAPAADIDPAYAAGLKAAAKAGVEILCYQCSVSPARIQLSAPLPVKF